MKSFNTTSKTLVLVAGVLASHFAFADQTGNSNGGLMKQMLNDSYKVSTIRSADTQKQLENVQIAKESGNGGLAVDMQPAAQLRMIGNQADLNSIKLGDTSLQGRN